jgi:demethylmenaquinone methyltransferase / 2-methoxy-6-polyprenyl-1,4-benzoquinol methylase
MGEPSARLSERTGHAKRLFAGLPSSYDRMGAVLSFGQDPRWRRFMVSRASPPAGGLVLDVATGTGMVAREVVRQTGAHVIALDQSEPMLARGREETARAHMSGVIRFALGRAEALPFPDEAFDAVTFTYLLRYVDDPGATLLELARVLRPGGTLANLEFHVPVQAFWKAMWMTYTRGAMPAAGRLVSRAWYDVGVFLGRSVSDFYRRIPLVEQLGMWRQAGIGDVRARTMSLGGGVVIWGSKGDGPGG